MLGGVFEAAREFLEVRQPERLLFAVENESLARLCSAYLDRRESELKSLGYKTDDAFKASPLAEYSIVKTTPSAWTD